MLNICTSYLVYNQIWLNLPKHHHHLSFFYIFLWMIVNFAALTLEGGREETTSELVPKIKIWKFRNPDKFDNFARGAG